MGHAIVVVPECALAFSAVGCDCGAFSTGAVALLAGDQIVEEEGTA